MDGRQVAVAVAAAAATALVLTLSIIYGSFRSPVAVPRHADTFAR